MNDRDKALQLAQSIAADDSVPGVLHEHAGVALLARALLQESERCERLEFTLHCRFAHPDYEYATTTTGRKSGESLQPSGEEWEPNSIVRISIPPAEPKYRNWERFEFTEDEYWRRRLTALAKDANEP